LTEQFPILFRLSNDKEASLRWERGMVMNDFDSSPGLDLCEEETLVY
jgi:hypothetical protein